MPNVYRSPAKLLQCHAPTGVLAQELLEGIVSREFIHRSCYTGDLLVSEFQGYAQTPASQVLLNLSPSLSISLFWRQKQPGRGLRNVTLCGDRACQTRKSAVKCEFVLCTFWVCRCTHDNLSLSFIFHWLIPAFLTSSHCASLFSVGPRCRLIVAACTHRPEIKTTQAMIRPVMIYRGSTQRSSNTEKLLHREACACTQGSFCT